LTRPQVNSGVRPHKKIRASSPADGLFYRRTLWLLGSMVIGFIFAVALLAFYERAP
jgi:hypothetical protein